MNTLIINLKNYSEILGNQSVKLASAAEAVAAKHSKIEIIVAPPHPALGLVAARVRIAVFSQSVSDVEGGMTTGAVIPEAVVAVGASGTLLNHSEARVDPVHIERLIPRLKKAGLKVCLCANSDTEAEELSRFRPEYLAVEPPELIGSGIAVSKARPEVVSDTVLRARRAGYEGKVLCGAGIVEGRDVEAAVKLGAEGVLVASSVVKAKNWEEKIEELAASLT
jgi:triosephosphate isomerase